MKKERGAIPILRTTLAGVIIASAIYASEGDKIRFWLEHLVNPSQDDTVKANGWLEHNIKGLKAQTSPFPICFEGQVVGAISVFDIDQQSLVITNPHKKGMLQVAILGEDRDMYARNIPGTDYFATFATLGSNSVLQQFYGAVYDGSILPGYNQSGEPKSIYNSESGWPFITPDDILHALAHPSQSCHPPRGQLLHPSSLQQARLPITPNPLSHLQSPNQYINPPIRRHG